MNSETNETDKAKGIKKGKKTKLKTVNNQLHVMTASKYSQNVTVVGSFQFKLFSVRQGTQHFTDENKASRK